VTVQQQALDQAIAQRDQARLQYKGDQVARVYVRRYEAQVAQSESDLIAAKNSLELAKNALNQTLARPIDTAVELIDITALTEVPVSVEDAVATAKTIRPEVRSLQNTIQALESSRRVTEASGAPSLSIGGQYQRSFKQSPRLGRK
jgi:outer membrane protein TolC